MFQEVVPVSFLFNLRRKDCFGVLFRCFLLGDWGVGSNISGDSSARMMSGSLMPCIRSSNAGMSFFIRNAILMVTD